MESKEKQAVIDTMLLKAGELEEAELSEQAARSNENTACNHRNEAARAYNTALEAYLKVFPKATV